MSGFFIALLLPKCLYAYAYGRYHDKIIVYDNNMTNINYKRLLED